MTKKRTILKTKNCFNQIITLIKTKKGYTITRYYKSSNVAAATKYKNSLYTALIEVLREEQDDDDYINLVENHLTKLKGKKESEILRILRKAS